MTYGPQGMAFDSSGNLYVAEATVGEIVKYNSSGVGTVFASGLVQPENIAFDSSGNLYVADYGSNRIMKYGTNGIGTVFASGLAGPVGIAVAVPEPSTWVMLVLGIGAGFGGFRARANRRV